MVKRTQFSIEFPEEPHKAPTSSVDAAVSQSSAALHKNLKISPAKEADNPAKEIEKPVEISLSNQMSALDYTEHYFTKFTNPMKKYGFNALVQFDRYFKTYLFEIRKHLSAELLKKTNFDSVTFKEAQSIDNLLKESFKVFNKNLPYSFKTARYRNMNKIYTDKFFSLCMPYKKLYDNAIKAGDKALHSKNYGDAIAAYKKALEHIDRDPYSRSQLQKIKNHLCNKLLDVYRNESRKYGHESVDDEQKRQIFLTAVEKFKEQNPWMTENILQKVEERTLEYIIGQ